MSYTHENRIDGFGAQYQGIITTLIFCKENNLKYIYSPLSSVEHNYDNDPNYINKLEKLINLKDNIKDQCEIGPQQLLFGNISNNFEQNIDKYCNSDSMKFIKDCFWEGKERNHFKNNKINIAVHIRRENLHDKGNAGDRANTPNEYYIRIMNEIRKKYNNQLLQFHIYSQGEIENFKDLENIDVEFHLNEEITKTFTGLVAADILILSPSSFSYIAGLLSDGIVYYKPFWHNPKKEWVLY